MRVNIYFLEHHLEFKVLYCFQHKPTSISDDFELFFVYLRHTTMLIIKVSLNLVELFPGILICFPIFTVQYKR